MAEPQILPLRSALSFAAGKREAVLDTWNAEIAKLRVDIRYGQEVVAIGGKSGAFEITTKSGETFFANKVILAIGLQGNLRALGVTGEDLPRVQYQLDDPQAYDGETIVVVGAGDAAIENALALAEQNQVILINRNDEFARCKEGNLTLVLSAIREGKLECRYGSSAMKIEDAGGDVPLRFKVKTPDGPDTIECHRVIARLGGIPPRKLVESFGVKFPSTDPNAVPRITDRYESNVDGLYIIGALGGYPLIKQAMNQGYEAVEFALGRTVAPADEPLLERKFAAFARGRSVAEVLDFVDDNAPLLLSINRLQLREFMLESELLVPREGDVIFKKNDYTNSFFMVVGGEALIEAASGNVSAWVPANSSASWAWCPGAGGRAR